MTAVDAEDPAAVARRKLTAALLRYRILAWITGTGLLVLVVIGIPLQALGNDAVVSIVGPLHGFIFIVYLITAFDLAIRCRWQIIATLLVMAAGTVPFVSFYAERRVTHWVQRRLSADAADVNTAVSTLT